MSFQCEICDKEKMNHSLWGYCICCRFLCCDECKSEKFTLNWDKNKYIWFCSYKCLLISVKRYTAGRLTESTSFVINEQNNFQKLIKRINKEKINTHLLLDYYLPKVLSNIVTEYAFVIPTYIDD